MAQYNLVNFGYNPWSHYWKRNQTIFHFLAREHFIHHAWFINPSLYLLDTVTHPDRIFRKPEIYKLQSIPSRRLSDRITVQTPVVLPASRRTHLVGRLDSAIMRRALHRATELPCIVVVNDPRREAVALANHVRRKSKTVLVFDYSDDFTEFASDGAERMELAESCAALCRDADLVTAVNDRLTSRARCSTDSVHTLCNATNYFMAKEPKSVGCLRSRFPSPIVGYLGWLNSSRLDLELVRFLATERPGWSLVFVGPSSHRDPLGLRSDLPPNVAIVKPVPYDHIRSVLASFDVCILPNRLNAHTDGNDPIKIFDYLASGNPIVSTRTAGTERFAAHLALADSKEEFLSAVSLALEEDSVEVRGRRVELARSHSWEVRYSEFRAHLMNTSAMEA